MLQVVPEDAVPTRRDHSNSPPFAREESACNALIITSITSTTRRVIRAISLCDGRRTCTARRRGVALALATPTSAKTNRVVRIGNGPSSEFGKSCDTNVVLSLLTLDINYFL